MTQWWNALLCWALSACSEALCCLGVCPVVNSLIGCPCINTWLYGKGFYLMQKTYGITNLPNELKMKIGSYFRTKARLGSMPKRKTQKSPFCLQFFFTVVLLTGVSIRLFLFYLKKKKTIKRNGASSNSIKFKRSSLSEQLPGRSICIWLTLVDLPSTFTVFYCTPLEESKWLKETLNLLRNIKWDKSIRF